MKINLIVLILFLTSCSLVSQDKVDNTLFEVETEEIALKITNDFNISKSLNIHMDIKRQILIPVLYKNNFIINEDLINHNQIYIYFPYDIEKTGIDMEVKYKIINSGDVINEKIFLKEIVNPVKIYFNYSYVCDSAQFDDIIEKKVLSNYFIKMKWGTFQFKKDL